MSTDDGPKMGLRERKKMKTRETIQQHAIRLFRERGYNETTVEQIAEAAEISPSTFFRYFPTKEAVIVEDDYDPLLIAAFQSQPPEISPIQALRNAARSGFSEISEEGKQAIRERLQLAKGIPEVRAASYTQVMNTMDLITVLVAERIGCPKDDFLVTNFAGAVIGAFLSAQTYSIQHPDENYIELFDRALAHLEKGLPLGKTFNKASGETE